MRAALLLLVASLQTGAGMPPDIQRIIDKHQEPSTTIGMPEGLAEVFGALDIDNDGALSFKEMGKLKEVMGYEFGRKELKMLDKDKSGDYSQDELADFMQYMQIESPHIYENAKRLMETHDEDGDGLMNLKEFFKLHGSDSSELRKQFTQTDGDHNQLLNVDELVNMMRKVNKAQTPGSDELERASAGRRRAPPLCGAEARAQGVWVRQRARPRPGDSSDLPWLPLPTLPAIVFASR
eukprot:CAMPEP_0197892622 /NCGR_PEP_ID=MMETSP1439-20131203/31058_1 /TAXON_ID=66791 /ORGANISM="Gonyaulax spinifera, Strain CCMP409" /LENGTH=236 /DNA_ID=CAMNT_0043512813 /DNA_START=29 /DNA_END=737 /DNA_ORIENTATION=+